MKSGVYAILCAFFVIACGGMSEEELYQVAQTAYRQKNFEEARSHLEELVSRFPQGGHAEESLFLLGTMYNDEIHDYRRAIDAFQRLRAGFPRGEKSPTALFLIGFIYNNQVHHYDSARTAYEQFLRDFPDHEMASSAKFELENLGKNPDEVFKTKIATKEEKKTKPTRRRK